MRKQQKLSLGTNRLEGKEREEVSLTLVVILLVGAMVKPMPTTVKTAISLDADLFKQAEALAGELRVSRSRLIAMALRDYLRRQHDKNLLDRLNAAYAEPLSEDERATLDDMQSYSFRMMASEEGS